MDDETLAGAGWGKVRADGFSSAVGQLWTRREERAREVGFVATPLVCNEHLGTVHGGALMTFTDAAFGYLVSDTLGAPYCTTAQLQLHFVAAGKIGDFVTCRPELVRRTSQLVFVRGLILAGDRTIASADGIWKILQPR